MTLMIAKEKELEKIGAPAVALGLAEVGIGSLLHGLHIPFAGTLLSLNQIFLITRHLALDPNGTTAPFSISVSAALLKCLAPIGKKLTPMLAICMQGLLYNIGIFCLGNTLMGRLTGSILSSLWSFCQQAVVMYFLFGTTFINVLEKWSWLKLSFIGLIAAKMAAAVFIAIFAPLLSTSRFEKYLQILSKGVQTAKSSTPSRSLFAQALADLCKPLFLFSLLITVFFFIFSQGMSQTLIWIILRPLGLGFLGFLIMRIFAHRT